MSAALPAEPRYDPRADTVEALDARLVALARGGAPLRRVLARVAGRLVETRGWEPLGFARAADYARERPGWSARELHELAHVDAALAKLPAIDAALESGRLGWTKARLLCRVATPADEARWLEAAGRLSAAALAREVRACDVGALEAGGAAAAGAEPDPEREVLRVRAPRHVLAQWGNVKRMLRLVAGEWLPTETCVELVAAEVLSAIGLDAGAGDGAPPLARGCRARASPADDEAGPAREPPAATGAPAVTTLPWVAALAAGLDAATPRDLDARLCRAAALERGWLARVAEGNGPGLGPVLLAFADARGHHAFGFRSLDAYARERLGMSPRKVRALLRLERACARSPALAAAWRAGRLPWSRAQALVPVLLAPGAERFHAAWLARAARVTARRLEDDVDAALASGEFDPALLPALPTGLQIGASHSEPQASGVTRSGARPTLDETNDTWVANVPRDVGRLFRACLFSMQRRLDASPGAALAAMFDHCIATWRARPGRLPAEHRVFERDGWRCSVPGCTSYRNLHAHHVLFRSAGGSNEAANLTTLCATHHQRGVHAGVIRISGCAPDRLVFELPLGRFGSGDLALPPAAGVR